MKKSKILLNLLVTTITTISLIAGTAVSASAHTLQYGFSVISDTHIGINDDSSHTQQAMTNTTRALNCIKNNFPNDKCIVINGDVVDNYYDSSYSTLANIVNNANSSGKRLPYIYFNLGNHEFKQQGTYSANPDDYNWCISQFVTQTRAIQVKLSAASNVSYSCRDTDKAYDLQHVNNTPFFFLGTDSINWGSTNDCAYLNPDYQLNYLDNHIGSGLSFVFCHQPPYDTVDGSNSSNCITNTDDLSQVLNRHPKAIMFTAHTHLSFENSSDYGKLGVCPIFSSPSIYENSEGYHVNVYDDCVYVQGIKYLSNNNYATNANWSTTVSR